MSPRMQEWIHHLNAKRGIALGIGPGLLALGADAGISHFAGGRPMAHVAQLVPLCYAPLACGALLGAALPRLSLRWFRLALRLVGIAGALVGAVGSGFHVRALLRLLEGEPLSLENLNAALAVAPPLFAPAAFLGIGVLLAVVASPRVNIRFRMEEGGGHFTGGAAAAT